MLLGLSISTPRCARWAAPCWAASPDRGRRDRASFGIGRGLGLTPKLAMLVACGNSICGNSAIAAVAPVIGADSRDVASSIAFTAVLGVIVVLALPLAAPCWAGTGCATAPWPG